MVTEQTGAEVGLEAEEQQEVEGQQEEPEKQTADKEVQEQEDINSLRAQIKTLEAVHEADTKRITDLKRQGRTPVPKDESLRTEIDALNKKLDLMMRHQAGVLNESAGTLEQQLAKIDAEYGTKRQSVIVQEQYRQHINESFEAIKDVFLEIGIEVESTDDADILSLQKKFNDSVSQGKPLTSVVAEASRIAAKKVKGSQPDLKKLREEIRKEILEERKGSTALKVETGGALGGTKTTEEQKLREMYPTMFKNKN